MGGGAGRGDWRSWLGRGPGSRLGPTPTAALFALVYLVCTSFYLAVAPAEVFSGPTRHDHYALLAEGWLEGRLHLDGDPPARAGMNDFARYEGRWYVVFPPAPAVLLVPWVALAGGAEATRDGLVFLLLAGLAPAASFVAASRLRETRRSPRHVWEDLALALSLGLGTVYFFTAVQGTVWYAAHVVGTTAAAAYLWLALDGRRPWLAGALLAVAALSRPPLLLAAVLFALEVRRRPDRWSRLAAFATPIGLAFLLWGALNAARFGDPFDAGYSHLMIRWRERIETWGLFNYHYLGRNLSVILASLPWLDSRSEPGALRISGHGLALWVTTPVLLAVARLRAGSERRRRTWRRLVWTAAAVAVPTLLYQNTGWVQFGYRFSSDYSPFLFAALAVAGPRPGACVGVALLWGALVNGFGALTFGKPEYAHVYHLEPTQTVLHQPD